MFPQISKRNKKQNSPTPAMYEEWDQLSKQIDIKVKNITKKLGTTLLSDFNKVCKLKQIPQFYSNYFIFSVHKNGQSQMIKIFTKQIQNILSNKSYFHLISQTLKERQDLIQNTKLSLVQNQIFQMIVEAFILMNQGKVLSVALKGAVDEAVKNCESLEKLKQMEKIKTEEVVQNIFKLRKNNIDLIQKNLLWRNFLEQNSTNQAIFRRTKIIFPYRGLNCLLMALYDTNFIKISALKSQLTFSRQDYDPFLEKISKSKKISDIQSYFLSYLKNDQKNFQKYTSIVKSQIPIDNQAKEILQQKQRQNAQKQEQKKIKQAFQKEKAQQQKSLKLQKINSEKNLKHQAEFQSRHRNHSFKPSKLQSQSNLKKTINIDSLLERNQNSKQSFRKKITQDNPNQPNKIGNAQAKILNIYKKSPNKSVKQSNNLNNDEQKSIFNEKRLLEKQLKKEIKQKLKMEKIFAKNQKQSIAQRQKYNQKLKKYEQQIQILKSKISERPKNRIPQQQRHLDQNHKIESIYKSSKKQKDMPTQNHLNKQLQSEIKTKQNLQQQIKELHKQKIRLQKISQKQAIKSTKQEQLYQKKIYKYQQIINKLKNQSIENQKIIEQLQASKIKQSNAYRKSLQNSRIKSQQNSELQQSIQKEKQVERNNKHKKRQRVGSSKDQSKLSISMSQKSQKNRKNNFQIVKTQNTIQIIFQSKSNQKKDLIHKNQAIIQSQSKITQLEKEKNILEKKLELSNFNKGQQSRLIESQIIKNQGQMNRVRKQIEKERKRNIHLENNMKNLRKNLNQQYELKLNKQKFRFQKEKQQLLIMIDKQRQEKAFKQKFLNQQARFLKEMQKKQSELLMLLENQKRKKREKEEILEEQIRAKQQLINLIQIEEIKKGIQNEVRKQLLDNMEEQSETDQHLRNQRFRIQQQMQNLKLEKEQQLKDLEEQNFKLKELIDRIKLQENTLLETIKKNVDLSEEDQQIINEQPQNDTHNQLFSSQQNRKAKVNWVQSDEEIMQELKYKTARQFQIQKNQQLKYRTISSSSNFKQKQKIQNLVEYYLEKPHQYPSKIKPVLIEHQKKTLINQFNKNQKIVQDFQRQLFSLKQLPNFVPSKSNDSLTNHLQNLRQVYEDYEAQSLRRQLFPTIREDEVYNDRQLSVESSQDPMTTLRDQVKAHEKKYKSNPKNTKKNFLAINKLRVVVLEDVKRDKQRKMIQQESKRKIKKALLQQNRKKKEQQRLQKQKQAIQKEEKSDNFDIKSQHSSNSSKKLSIKIKNNKKSKNSESEKDISDGQNQKIKKRQIEETRKNKKSPPKQILKKQGQNEKILPIKQEQMQQSGEQGVNEFLQNEKDQKKIKQELLEEQVRSLQDQIRSYISSEKQFKVYQHFIQQADLEDYLKKMLNLSSEEIKDLNHNQTLFLDVKEVHSLTILIAIDTSKIEIGIGIFHRQFENGEYVCDYLLAHNMQNFLNLAFNFSKFLFKADKMATKIQYLFNLQNVKDKETITNFLQFEDKCKRLGQVYVKAKSSMERKYVLRRNLFEEYNKIVMDAKGFEMKLNLYVHENKLKQINKLYGNKNNINYGSISTIFSYYLKNSEQKLITFRENADNDLKYRQSILTALLFSKKQLEIKNLIKEQLSSTDLQHFKEQYGNSFQINSNERIEQMKFALNQRLPKAIKRCILEIDKQQTNYLLQTPQQALTRIQSSNSSETGTFINLIPKYKILFIEAEQFLTMSKNNPDLTAFFYIRHFIKNIVDVKKQNYSRVFIPQIHEDDSSYFSDISTKIRSSLFLKQVFNIGWQNNLANSIIFTPKHKDLVIQKPFIFAVLSGNIERAVEGSPICIKLII